MKEKETPIWLYSWFDIRIATDVTNHNKLHGCLIVKNGFRQGNIPPTILSYGQNAERPSPFIQNGKTKTHAEMNAIYRLPRNRSKTINVDLIVFRVNRKLDLRDSMPCSLCMNCIQNTLIKVGYVCRFIWFSTKNNIFLGKRFEDLHQEYEESQRMNIGWGPRRDESRKKISQHLKV